MLLALVTAIAGPSGAPIDVVSFADLGLGLPPCKAPATGNGKLDLTNGCVDGACASAAFEEVKAALGPAVPTGRPPPAIHTMKFRGGDISRIHRDGSRTASLFVNSADYQTADGLSVGVSGACFLERWGESARNASIDVHEGKLYLQGFHLTNPRIGIDLDSKGMVAQIQLSSTPRR